MSIYFTDHGSAIEYQVEGRCDLPPRLDTTLS